MNKQLAVGITGSFCNHPLVIKELQNIKEAGYDITFLVTPNVAQLDTRFGKANDLLAYLEQLSEKKVISSIVESEWLVTQKKVDQMIIMPCSATTCGKLVHGIYDNAVLMCAKSLLRNENPISVAIATNDGLGISGKNIMQLLSMKNLYLVPFGQDDYVHKPNSLVCDFRLCIETLSLANQKKQIQPVILGAKGVHYE